MGTTKNYASNEVSASLSGRELNDGRASDEFMTVAWNSELYTLKKGADGFGVRSKSNDFSAKVTLKLLRSSPVHRTLTAMMLLSRDSTNGDDMGVFLARDRNDGLEYKSEKSWISKHPDLSFGTGAGEVSWVITCDDLRPIVEVV